jgi:hypothetical protein
MEIKVGDWIHNSNWGNGVEPIQVAVIRNGCAYYEITPEIINKGNHWYEGMPVSSAYYILTESTWSVIKKSNLINRKGVRYVKSR